MTQEFDDIKKDGLVIDSDEAFADLFNEDEPEETTEDSSPEETGTETDSEQSEDNSEAGEEKTEEEKPAKDKTEEKVVPFHEHPRWKKQQEELKELREFKESQSELSEKVEQIQKRTEANQATQLPKWWTTLYGSDEVSAAAYTEYSSHESETRAAIKEEILNEQKSSIAAQEAESKKWDDWVDSEIETLKSEGNEFTKNELLKVATEMQPIDENGNISLRKSLQILKMQKASTAKPKDATDRKKVAELTNSDNNGSPTAVTTPSMHNMRGKSMQELLHGKD